MESGPEEEIKIKVERHKEEYNMKRQKAERDRDRHGETNQRKVVCCKKEGQRIRLGKRKDYVA
jgi:hypothetical protein